MPRPSQLSSVPTEALVEELKKRFEAIEKAKALLLGSRSVLSTVAAPGQRKRGGTSPYARQISSLVQKIRHAKGRGESTGALEKQLSKLRAQNKR